LAGAGVARLRRQHQGDDRHQRLIKALLYVEHWRGGRGAVALTNDHSLNCHMSWCIVVRKDEQPILRELQTRQAAVTIASLLLEQGIEVERIEGPDDQRLDPDAIRRLSGAT
jgi:hypothetical protein